ncbi:hypothetical protein GBM03_03095 [Yersinia pseudotuberculosis]|nr:hypothetical protein [Yersinia pseudotuberculosis]MBO1568882.1 hypothetical protein [Yersinia pseudotuberculosis]MBO1584030.1 hypothetical protein [Yersinia pseudotuberculosis]MBO1634027.1 hypothetical protein [Yersinia pseudotuberculosis]
MICQNGWSVLNNTPLRVLMRHRQCVSKAAFGSASSRVRSGADEAWTHSPTLCHWGLSVARVMGRFATNVAR